MPTIKDSAETLCGKAGISVWTENVEEITCPDCQNKIPSFTAKEAEAAFIPALVKLVEREP